MHVVWKYATAYGVTAGSDASFSVSVGGGEALPVRGDYKTGVSFGTNATKPGDMVQVCEPDDPNHRAPRGYGPDPRNMTDQELANRIRDAQEALEGALARYRAALEALEACKAEQAQGHPKGAHPGPDPNSAYTPAGTCRDCVDCSDPEAEYAQAVREYQTILEQWQYLSGIQDDRREAAEGARRP